MEYGCSVNKDWLTCALQVFRWKLQIHWKNLPNWAQSSNHNTKNPRNKTPTSKYTSGPPEIISSSIFCKCKKLKSNTDIKIDTWRIQNWQVTFIAGEVLLESWCWKLQVNLSYSHQPSIGYFKQCLEYFVLYGISVESMPVSHSDSLFPTIAVASIMAGGNLLLADLQMYSWRQSQLTFTEMVKDPWVT